VIEPFAIHVPDEALRDLAARIDRTRWPTTAAFDDGWSDGTDGTFLRQLLEYWGYKFDWPEQETELNRLRQLRIRVDDVRVHTVHVRGRGPRPMPLVLTHGWPSTFAEFVKVIGPLSDPAAYGGDADDAFNVVVPSLPGYGFSDPLPPGQAGRTMELWVRLMETLGYRRFAAHGGDIGGYVTNQLARHHPDRLIGVHTTYPVEPSNPNGAGGLSDEERAFYGNRARTRELGGGYTHIQRTRPRTLSYGLTDSPAAVAAWIVDKWREWSDCAGDLLSRFSRDELLITISLYWFTKTIATSFDFYRDWGLGAPPRLVAETYPHSLPGVDPRPLEPGETIDVPAGVAIALDRYPEAFVRRGYSDLRQLTHLPRGGHFPALEEPDLLVNDIRTFFRPLRAKS
jgi:pimeloyl-ACP methyl ester carboxylesterase